MTELDSIRFKRCRLCGCTKPLTTVFFQWVKPTARQRNNRFLAVCRRCQSLRQREYAAKPERRERIRVYNEQYRAENHEHLLELYRAYKIEHRNDPEYKNKKKALAKRLYEKRMRENPDKERKRLRVKENKRRAQKLASDGSFTPEDVQQMYEDQGGLCAYCETVLFGQFQLDHMIPLSRGGSNDILNIAITCAPCNLRKHARTPEEFWRGM